jgi:hypothetical protein
MIEQVRMTPLCSKLSQNGWFAMNASGVADVLMSLFVFYTVITVHNLLIFAPNRLQNTRNGH